MNRIPNHLNLCIILLISLISCSQEDRIKEKPIIFNELRNQLTLDYMAERYDVVQEFPNIDPKIIVLHWTVFPTLEEAFEAGYVFQNDRYDFDHLLIPLHGFPRYEELVRPK